MLGREEAWEDWALARQKEPQEYCTSTQKQRHALTVTTEETCVCEAGANWIQPMVPRFTKNVLTPQLQHRNAIFQLPSQLPKKRNKDTGSQTHENTPQTVLCHVHGKQQSRTH